ncbi:GNAT family N-acetyltransferase [Pseudalkalibacillus berkeleyi]|uniref:GNAT family N-acetyltransferase n=1 Tax=Pseudalkalibacillus berkeleyi TaxID=1069813 RepID=A0ABS9H2W6_9BACL|nr:GNAT family N-acetyltransferase [Pseudalkalibacillus berkeleyi]MCF6138254.1 GNAT family N-acetyltransferase [Pseudalkalibacillus berkeleyi]
MELTIRRRTKEDINEFITWTYEGKYSFYDNNIQEEKIEGFKQSIHLERAFSVVDEEENLIGNCEFFDVEEDGEEILVVGVQMKPSITGRGYGSKFVKAIIEQGKELLKFNHLELAVVDFNERAIRTYEKEGFIKKGEFQNEISGSTYNFIIMARDWG